jgi:hypothetical protein
LGAGERPAQSQEKLNVRNKRNKERKEDLPKRAHPPSATPVDKMPPITGRRVGSR